MTRSQTPTRAIKRSLQYKRPQQRMQPANSNHKHHIRRPPPPYHRSIHTHTSISIQKQCHTQSYQRSPVLTNHTTSKGHIILSNHNDFSSEWVTLSARLHLWTQPRSPRQFQNIDIIMRLSGFSAWYIENNHFFFFFWSKILDNGPNKSDIFFKG